MILRHAKQLRHAIQLFQANYHLSEERNDESGYSLTVGSITCDDWNEVDRFLKLLKPIANITKFLEGNLGTMEYRSIWAVFPTFNMLGNNTAVEVTKDEPAS